MEPNVFETANAGFAQIMYEEYLRDPTAVSEEWRRFFQNGVSGLPPEDVPTVKEAHGPEDRRSGGPADQRTVVAPASAQPTSASDVRPAVAQSASPPTRQSTSAVPITGPAARLVANMNESRSMPTATSFRELSVAMLEARRRDLNNALRSAGRTEKVSFTHLIGYAVARAGARHAALTTVYVEIDGAPHRVPGGAVHLGIAVDVERKDGSRGLVVPVIRDAATKTFAEFHAVYESLVEKARGNKLMPDAFVRREHDPDQPRRSGDGGIRPAADAGPRQYHRGGGHRLPGRIQRRLR